MQSACSGDGGHRPGALILSDFIQVLTIKTPIIMAKGNMFLGLARGSVGDVTFYRRNAQQISRVRVRKVKNPQSNAQMWQRAINHTAVQAYSVLKKICDHSYQGVTYGANSYSKFLSLNMDMLRREAGNTIEQQSVQKAYCPFGFQGISAMPYIISTGTIPAPIVEFGTGSTGEGVRLFKMPEVAISEFSYKSFADLLGAQEGDQVTILRVPDPKDFGGVDEPLGLALLDSRFILSPAQGSFDSTPIFVSGGTNLTINQPNIRNEGSSVFFVDTQNNLYASADGFGEDNVGFACIISRQQSDGTWLRSNAVFLYNPLYRQNGYTLKQASDLGQIDLYVENDKYLNNAE